MWDTPLFEQVDDERDVAVDYLGETTFGDLALVQIISTEGVVKALGASTRDELLGMSHAQLKERVNAMLHELGVTPTYPGGTPHRGVYCSRTLNLRSIRAIGYDMDYTLLQYDVNRWEGRAYDYSVRWLRAQGVNTEGLEFDPEMVIRGLIVDKHLGNLIKVDRFGLVKRAMHGGRMMSPADIHAVYGREYVNLRNEDRYEFLNTLFSVSEAVIYQQLVQRLDEGCLGQLSPQYLSYEGLATLVGRALFNAHVESQLKQEIMDEPEKFVVLDPELALTLLDQKGAGKKLLLITNSDFAYTDKLMSFAYDRYLPEGMTYRDLFDLIIVQARKPVFFKENSPLFQIVTEDGLMRPVMGMSPAGLQPAGSSGGAVARNSVPEHRLVRGRVFCGGSARMVEEYLGLRGDDIMYVGDHIYTDNALAKLNMRWRTALIIRELEEEIEALARGREHRRRLKELMNNKELLGDVFNQIRLFKQRKLTGGDGRRLSPEEDKQINDTLAQFLLLMESLDARIAPMMQADGEHFSRKWGYLSRAGLNDKARSGCGMDACAESGVATSHVPQHAAQSESALAITTRCRRLPLVSSQSQLARQIEKYADIYTSRVSNFLRYTPFNYFR